jgi:hypothetical protein
LRAAKTTEGTIGDSVGLADATPNVDIRDLIATVDVAKGTVHNGCRKILRPPSVIIDIRIKSQDLAIVVDPHLPNAEEWMTLTRSHNVFVSIEHTSDRALGLVSSNCTYSRKLYAPGLFAPESTA